MDLAHDIRQILARDDALAPIAADLAENDSLFDKGLTSFGSVQLMLALEERFGIEFPDELLNRKSFATIGAIAATVATLIRPEAA